MARTIIGLQGITLHKHIEATQKRKLVHPVGITSVSSVSALPS
jgi:hypothetical protein